MILVEADKTRILTEMWTAREIVIRFQTETRILEIGLQVTVITL